MYVCTMGVCVSQCQYGGQRTAQSLSKWDLGIKLYLQASRAGNSQSEDRLLKMSSDLHTCAPAFTHTPHTIIKTRRS